MQDVRRHDADAARLQGDLLAVHIQQPFPLYHEGQLVLRLMVVEDIGPVGKVVVIGKIENLHERGLPVGIVRRGIEAANPHKNFLQEKYGLRIRRVTVKRLGKSFPGMAGTCLMEDCAALRASVIFHNIIPRGPENNKIIILCKQIVSLEVKISEFLY